MAVSKILDASGNPIQIKELAGEPQTARVAALYSEFADHPTRGLTPAKLARLYEDAEQGDLTAQAQLAEDMEEKDAHLYAELSKRRLAWLTVDWNLVPPLDATPAEKKATAELEALMRDALDIDALLQDLAGALLPGYACVELSWAQTDNRWLPTPYARPADWFTVLPEARDVLRLRTQTPGGEALRPWGWITHLHPAKSGYVTRAGLVRMLGWPFIFRNLTARDLAEFLEIYGLPLRLGRYPNGASSEEKSTLMQAVVNIGHAAAGILPEGMSIEFQEAAKGAADPFMGMIAWAEASISKAILGGTLTSQVDGKGSYAAAQTHNEVRGDILKADLRLVARSLTRDLVVPLARLNTSLTRMPSFEFDLSENEDITALADALPKLVDAGVQIPARWVHEKLAIPEAQNNEPVLARPAPPSQLTPPSQPSPMKGEGASSTTKPAAATNSPAPSWGGVGVGGANSNHVTGCQCSGCTGVAALAATTGQTTPDPIQPAQQIAARLTAEAQPVMADWLAQIEAMLESASSLDEFKAMLLAAFDQLPTDKMGAVMSDAIIAASAAGRFDVAQTGDNQSGNNQA